MMVQGRRAAAPYPTYKFVPPPDNQFQDNPEISARTAFPGLSR